MLRPEIDMQSILSEIAREVQSMIDELDSDEREALTAELFDPSFEEKAGGRGR